ncbi:Histidine kinase [Spirosomataceae bacterium TFI 002]|nr:Histidine kinase [Spirosomataceae bacterium TFI 002]
MGGLDRYDGYSIKSYRGLAHNNRDLSYRQLSSIAEGHNGDLLLGTQEEGLIYFDRRKETFEPIHHIIVGNDSIRLGQINAIRKKGENELIIATAFQGIYKLNLDSRVYCSVAINHPKFSSASVNNLVITSNGRIALSSTSGVFVENEFGDFELFPIDRNNFIKYIIELPDGNLLARPQNKPVDFLLDLDTKTVKRRKNSNDLLPCCGITDSNGAFWLNNEDGSITKTIGENESNFNINTKFQGMNFPVCALDMLQTDRGRIFFVSYMGAGSFSLEEPAIKKFIKDTVSVFHFFDGDLYFASGNTLYKHTEKGKQKILESSPQHAKYGILNFHKDRNGEYWVGHISENSFASHFDKNGKLIGETYPSSLSTQYLELDSGVLTVGNEIKGDIESKKKYKFIGDLYQRITGKKYPNFRVKYYTQLKNGEIWIATFSDGVYIIDKDKKGVRTLPIDKNGNGKLNSNNPYYIYEHSSGKVLISTELGINIWDPLTGKFSYLNEQIEKYVLDVRGMVEDANQTIWMVTFNSFYSYNLATNELKEFPVSEDIYIDTQEPTDLHFTKNGEILFQGFNHIYAFHPSSLMAVEPPVDVLFTDVFVNRSKIYPSDSSHILTQSILFQKSFEASFDHRNIGFSFVSIGGSENNISYYYRLIGENEEWVEAKSEREVHYSSLSPGKYIFEVKAKGGTGLWTANTPQIEFTILPPWYETWVAYMLYFMGAAFIIYFIYRLRVKQLLKYRDLRVKVSSDLHDDVGSLLTGVSLKSQLLAMNKSGKEKKILNDLSELSQKAMEQMRDIVWALDARKDSIDDLKLRMIDFAEQNLTLKNIKYKIEVKTMPGLKGINPEQRQNIYYIFKEAVTNILKHSNASHVNVFVQKNAKNTTFIIHDNGIVTDDIKLSGQGLSNIQMRVERLNGKVIFDSSKGFKISIQY